MSGVKNARSVGCSESADAQAARNGLLTTSAIPATRRKCGGLINTSVPCSNPNAACQRLSVTAPVATIAMPISPGA